MLPAPVAVERTGDLRFGRLAALVTMLRQLPRITLATYDVLDDLHPGLAHDVADHLGQLDVHLFQHLLHVLHVLSGVADQHLALPLKATPPHDLVRRTKGRREQSVAVQPPYPLAIQHVALGPARRMRRLPRIHQDHLEALAGEQVEQGNPKHPRRLHGHRLDVAILQPGRERFQVAGVGAELAHPNRQFRIRIDEPRRHVFRRHRHEMHLRMHVDARGMPMRDRQILGLL